MTWRCGASIALATVVLLGAGASGPEPGAADRAAAGEVEVVEVHFAMSTPVRIAARGSAEAPVRAAVRAAFAEIRRLEDILSTFDPGSDASRVNRSSGGEPVAVAAELAELLGRSRSLSLRTGGAFSVLVGPLVETWRAAVATGRTPEPAQIERALALARPDLVTIDGLRVRMAATGMRIDLGGIAKGFAADRALDRLRTKGASAAIVDLGGSSIAAFGDAGDGESGWPVAIPNAEPADAGDPWSGGVLRLRDGALSTSATYGRSLVPGSGRGHIVDPRTGRLLEADAMAIVRHPAATDAEALSKALLILGDEAAPVLRAADAEGLLIDAAARARCTPGFRSIARGCTVLRPRKVPLDTRRG